MTLRPRRGFLRPPPLGKLVSNPIKHNTDLEEQPPKKSLERRSLYQQQQQKVQKTFADAKIEQSAADQRWTLPDYTDPTVLERPTAFNYNPKKITPHLLEETAVETLPQITEEEIEQIKARAYQEGFSQGEQDGYAQGHEQGLESGKTEGLEQGQSQGYQEGIRSGQIFVQEQIDQLTTLLEQFVVPLQQVDQEVEQQMVKIVVALAKELIKVELKTNPQILLHTLQNTIQSLPEQKQEINVYLNPDDLSIIKQYYDDATLAEHRWHLFSDPIQPTGNLRIESGYSTSEYDIEEKVKELFLNFALSNQQHTKNYQPEPTVISYPELEDQISINQETDDNTINPDIDRTTVLEIANETELHNNKEHSKADEDLNLNSNQMNEVLLDSIDDTPLTSDSIY